MDISGICCLFCPDSLQFPQLSIHSEVQQILSDLNGIYLKIYKIQNDYLFSFIQTDYLFFHYQQNYKMPEFLESHFKLQNLQNRLSKNQYLSSDCLPNYMDAKVFKTLKIHDKIPKRTIYPSFYHWYILMRQFSQNSLQHWLKNKYADYESDNVVYEAIKAISGQGNQQKRKLSKETTSNIFFIDKNVQSIQRSISVSLFLSHSLKESTVNLSSVSINSFELPKVSSHIEKKPKSQQDYPISYIMDIKLNSEISHGYDDIKQIFEAETYRQKQFSIKLQSIKVISGSDVGYDVRVFFLTLEPVCEQLKGRILACNNVQTIQCKKHKRNQSL